MFHVKHGALPRERCTSGTLYWRIGQEERWTQEYPVSRETSAATKAVCLGLSDRD